MPSANPELDKLAAAFEKKARALARKVDLRIEKILLDYVDLVARNPSESALLILRDRVVAEIDFITKTAYGPTSPFAKTSKNYLVQASGRGRAKFIRELKGIGFRAALKLSSIDPGSITRAATDVYSLAGRYLSEEAVADLRSALVEEFVRGGGEKALRDRLISGGFIEDLQLGKRTLRGETRAAMMARTEPHRLANAEYRADASKLEPDPKDRFYQWVSALGPTVGEDSLRRHGTILSEQEWQTTDFGDGMYGLPPIRPNDNCSFIFYPRSALPPDLEKIIADKEAGEDRRTVGATDGPIWEKLYSEKVLKRK